MDNPSAVSLCSMKPDDWVEYVRSELSSINDEVDKTERLVYFCMKLGCAVNDVDYGERADVRDASAALCGE